MKLDEAIDLMTLAFIKNKPVLHTDLYDACRLGIEALQRVKDLRPYHDPEPTWLLPGETE